MTRPSDIKILVVEDEPDNAELIELHLDGLGYKTTVVCDGESAISLLKQAPDSWSVVLLDRLIPGINGLDVAMYIRDEPALQHLPVVMQTACASFGQIQEGIEAGVFHYLTKPFSGSMLRTVVQSALELRQKYVRLQEETYALDRALTLMESGCFRLKTLVEGQLLSSKLAKQFQRSGEIALGLNELITNAIEHGNLGISFHEKTELVESGQWMQEIERRLQLPEYRERSVELSIEKRIDRTYISIKDEGDGFDWRSYMDMSMSRVGMSHGRGIAIANMKCFDDIQFLGEGNEVQVEILTKPQGTKPPDSSMARESTMQETIREPVPA